MSNETSRSINERLVVLETRVNRLTSDFEDERETRIRVFAEIHLLIAELQKNLYKMIGATTGGIAFLEVLNLIIHK